VPFLGIEIIHTHRTTKPDDGQTDMQKQANERVRTTSDNDDMMMAEFAYYSSKNTKMSYGSIPVSSNDEIEHQQQRQEAGAAAVGVVDARGRPAVSALQSLLLVPPNARSTKIRRKRTAAAAASILLLFAAIAVTVFPGVSFFEQRPPLALLVSSPRQSDHKDDEQEEKERPPSSMMSLLLFRHAKAQREHRGDELLDFDRKLSPRGREEADWVGRQLVAQKIEPPDLVLASGSARTRETLARALEATEGRWMTSPGSVPIVYAGELYDLASVDGYEGYVRYLAELSDVVNNRSSFVPHRRVMVVGHNPAVEDLYNWLLPPLRSSKQRKGRRQRRFPTGGLADVDLKGLESWSDLDRQQGKGRIRAFLEPPAPPPYRRA